MNDLASSDDTIGFVRILGRAIMAVSLLFGLFIFLFSEVESGPSGLRWHVFPIASAVGFGVAGLFAWGALRGIAQIRDRVEELVEEEG